MTRTLFLWRQVVKRPKTVSRMSLVWDRLMRMALDSRADEEIIAAAFNEMLDALRSDDFFGTEGQLDPRGDTR